MNDGRFKLFVAFVRIGGNKLARSRRASLCGLLAGMCFLSVLSLAANIDLSGAGSLAAEAVEPAWSAASASTGSEFNLRSSGSSSETSQFLQGTMDFVVSDVPLTDKELREARGRILHFPTVVSGDAIIYNVPDARAGGPLHLTGPILADIYLGKLKEWDAPAIRAINPHIVLKHRPIVPVCVQAESGASSILADYLSKTSPSWRSRFQSSSWPKCSESRTDAEAIEKVAVRPGAIGYAGLGFPLNHVPTAAILNRDGRSTEPSVETLEAAAVNSAATIPSDFRMSITDAPGANSYPIASYSYMLLYQHQANREAGAALLRFLRWVLHDGQKDVVQMNYAPLPSQLVQREQEQLQDVFLPPADE